jgi:hypothetical protein
MLIFFVFVMITMPVWASFSGLAQRPPHQQAVIRTSVGAAMIAGAIYIFLNIGRISSSDAMSGVFLICCGVLLVTGALWFFVYIGRTRGGDREIIGAVWAATQLAMAGGLLYWVGTVPAKPDDSAFLEVMLRAVLIWWIIASAVKFLLYSRQPRREGLREVAAQRAHGDARAASETEVAAALKPAKQKPKPRQFDK